MSQKYIVSFCTNLTAADTFQEESHQGPTQRTEWTEKFDTFEAAEKFYKQGKANLFGDKMHYYTYPVEEPK